jgi:hypothetical protein
MINVGHLSDWMRRRRASRRRFNPYIAGTPVFDRHLFFGRQQLALSTVRLLGSRSVTLTGERRIGKTSFLHHLQGVLAADQGRERRFFPVFVDLEAVAAPGFFHAVMDETIEALALSPRTRSALRFSGEHNGYRADDFAQDLRRVVEELRQRTRVPVGLVLLIDEVDALREHLEQTGEHWLGSLLESCPRELRLVLAGVGRDVHATLDELVLEPLTPKEAAALVTRPVAGVFRYEAPAVERILQLSSLRPYRIQRLCLHAVNRMLDDGRTTVRVADVGAGAFTVTERTQT